MGDDQPCPVHCPTIGYQSHHNLKLLSKTDVGTYVLAHIVHHSCNIILAVVVQPFQLGKGADTASEVLLLVVLMSLMMRL